LVAWKNRRAEAGGEPTIWGCMARVGAGAAALSVSVRGAGPKAPQSSWAAALTPEPAVGKPPRAALVGRKAVLLRRSADPIPRRRAEHRTAG